ncbi:hypothetical protein ACFP81_12095 [Deinococcus lacus]|uniref:Malto-oligosyltrehalose synthase n=1 Tax=Deinococcus lacus TaxID=392561 RepID=A0ABW1YGI7_9DEIO
MVEKILEPGEALPRWETWGTTGYDALGEIDRLLTDPAGEAGLTRLDTSLRGGTPADWQELAHAAKRNVAETALRAEVTRLARSAGLPWPQEVVADALAEVLACFGVYRTYLPQGRHHLVAALQQAGQRRPDLGEVLQALGPVLGVDVEAAEQLSETALRFQQTSGMVMAKGVEDSAFYRFTRLTSLNEVGGDPSQFALTPQQVHAAFAQRQREWPQSLTALSTHDTKRSETVRARITVLSEDPQGWAELVGEVQRGLGDLAPLRDGPLLNLLLQALVGAWPLSEERAQEYALKAAREAGLHTTWTDPDPAFEAELAASVSALLGPLAPALERYVERVLAAGFSNALAQKLVQLTMPGVPDVYQGSELWAPALVDPDNRRPVDFGELRAALRRVLAAEAGPVPTHEDAKLLLTQRALHLRRDRPELFSGYQPLHAVGSRAEHVFAFDRGGAISVVTRLPLGLQRAGGWEETCLALPSGTWRDALTNLDWSGQPLLSELLRQLPVALLHQI